MERILVTGGSGSIGAALLERLHGLREVERSVVLAPGETAMDIRDDRTVAAVVRSFEPTLIYHLAGAKHAPDGETDPVHVLDVNANGTWHLLEAASAVAAKVVTASTCKAADPETAYGASKLLAERMTLAAGGVVARFYNVRESAGNVFETWAAIPEGDPLPVSDCRRYFIGISDAVALLLACGTALPSGRYTLDPGPPRSMWEVAASAYPGRPCVAMDRRRGDRRDEPRHAACESIVPVSSPSGGQSGFERIVSPHDEAFA